MFEMISSAILQRFFFDAETWQILLHSMSNIRNRFSFLINGHIHICAINSLLHSRLNDEKSVFGKDGNDILRGLQLCGEKISQQFEPRS